MRIMLRVRKRKESAVVHGVLATALLTVGEKKEGDVFG